VRFNPAGEFNQSPDKRRKGTHPERMRAELIAAYELLHDNCVIENLDFMQVFAASQPGDFFYLDPPYQGTSNGRDRRYISGVTRERIIEGLELLNEKGVPFILSYDGSCGDRTYGDPLPEGLAHRLSLEVGRSAQATLNGTAHRTIESVYVSHSIAQPTRKTEYALHDFAPQAALFG
jgi:DNA adenine methylase